MRQGNVWDGLDLGHLQDPQIGLPLLEPIERIMIGAKVFGHRAVPSNGPVEHPAECDTIDRSGMDAESNGPYADIGITGIGLNRFAVSE